MEPSLAFFVNKPTDSIPASLTCPRHVEQASCEADSQCGWHRGTGTCYGKGGFFPWFEDKLDAVSDSNVQGALEKAASLTNFKAIVGEHPNPQRLLDAYIWQKTYEMKKGKLSEAAKAEFDEIDYRRSILQAELDKIIDPILWYNSQAYELETSEPNPNYDGKTDKNEYIKGTVTIRPGDIVWGGRRFGLVGDAHFEVYICKIDGVPWSVGLGVTAGVSYGSHFDMLEFESMPSATKYWHGAVIPGKLSDNMASYKDTDTIGLMDGYPIETRIDPIMTCRLAVACSGLWYYKLYQISPYAIMEFALAKNEMKNANNCQQWASYIQTGSWHSPGLTQMRSRIFSVLYRVIADTTVMAAQTVRMMEVDKNPNMSVFGTMKKFGIFNTFKTGTPETRKYEYETQMFKTVGHAGVTETAPVKKWPVGVPDGDAEASKCAIEKMSEFCFREACRRRILELVGESNRIMLGDELLDQEIEKAKKRLNIEIKLINDRFAKDAIRELVARGVYTIKKATSIVGKLLEFATPNDLRVWRIAKADIIRLVGVDVAVKILPVFIYVEEGEFSDLYTEQHWVLEPIKNDIAKLEQRKLELLADKTRMVTRQVSVAELDNQIKALQGLLSQKEGELNPAGIDPKYLVGIDLNRLVKISCQSTVQCRDINGLRDILVRQASSVAYDPGTLTPFGQSVVDSIMSAPPALTPSIDMLRKRHEQSREYIVSARKEKRRGPNRGSLLPTIL